MATKVVSDLLVCIWNENQRAQDSRSERVCRQMCLGGE